MKIIRLQASGLTDGLIKLVFNKDHGLIPQYPNCINESGYDVAVGKVSDDSNFYHHIDLDGTRYLIYTNEKIGCITGSELLGFDRALKKFLLEEQTNF